MKRRKKLQTDKTELIAALIERQDAIARRAARQIAQLKTGHLDAKDVARVWAGYVIKIRMRLNRIPMELAAGLVTAAQAGVSEVDRFLTERVRAILYELAGWKGGKPPKESAPQRPRAVRVNPARSLPAARARVARSEAARIVLKERVAAGALLPVEQVERTWEGRVQAVRTSMLNWPVTLSDQIHRAVRMQGRAGVEDVLSDAVAKALREMNA